MKKKYKILKRNKSCVLLQKVTDESYKVIDIENVTIFIGFSYENAEECFNTYDLNKIHKEQKETLEKWLKDFAEA